MGLLRAVRKAAIGEIARVGEEPSGKALYSLIRERAATANSIAYAVVESANAEAVEIDLRGVGTDLIIRGVSEVKTLSV